jgi:RNA polymerase-binding transcription factor DksA
MNKRSASLLTPVQLAGLRARLLAARGRVLRTLAMLREGAGTGAAESEFEERSQAAAVAAVETRLAEGEFARLRKIEGALHRMVLDTYGLCTRSASPIAYERLRADPTVALCPDCAKAAEREVAVARTAGAASDESDEGAPAELPSDLSGFDDAEIAALVRETFRRELGGGLTGMRVGCRCGRVILGGEVASDELRQVALQVVEDELGLAVIDRLRVTGGGGYAAERDPGAGPIRLDPSEIGIDFGEGEGGSGDLFTVDEDGLSYTPPVTPVAGLD